MNTAWIKGLTKGSEYEKDVRAAYAESALIRKRLVEVLENMYMGAAKERLSASGYENPSWAFLQADAVGYARALQDILRILEDK